MIILRFRLIQLRFYLIQKYDVLAASLYIDEIPKSVYIMKI